jgi:uncharacterized protein YndB with AHSA1/START domain
MRQFRGTASIVVPAPPSSVFNVLVDVDHLPDWNHAIARVVERPAELIEGAEWTVTIKPHGLPRWNSISRVEVLDRDRLTFRHRTRNADGNPSYVIWTWSMVPQAADALVEVTWECRLETLDRRWFGGPVRKHQLVREVPRSLHTLAGFVATGSAGSLP